MRKIDRTLRLIILVNRVLISLVLFGVIGGLLVVGGEIELGGAIIWLCVMGSIASIGVLLFASAFRVTAREPDFLGRMHLSLKIFFESSTYRYFGRILRGMFRLR